MSSSAMNCPNAITPKSSSLCPSLMRWAGGRGRAALAVSAADTGGLLSAVTALYDDRHIKAKSGRRRMRYGPEHSEKTRQRVVKIAAAQMRKHGPDKVGVAEVMGRAGLTHGGFYAHFQSKDDLIAAAVTRMFEESRERFREWTEGKSRPEALRAYINAYVSAQ